MKDLILIILNTVLFIGVICLVSYMLFFKNPWEFNLVMPSLSDYSQSYELRNYGFRQSIDLDGCYYEENEGVRLNCTDFSVTIFEDNFKVLEEVDYEMFEGGDHNVVITTFDESTKYNVRAGLFWVNDKQLSVSLLECKEGDTRCECKY